MNPTNKPTGKREITYQVGWKKGKIRLNESGKAIVPVPVYTDFFHPRQETLSRWGSRLIWREAAFIPAQAAFLLLWILPMFSFAAVLWLVYQLVGGV